jgi:hypothetical protein
MAHAEEAVNWMWNNFGDPSNLVHLAYVVRAIPPVLRGTASAHQCVVEAIKAARAGDHDLAVSWLKAGQAHNTDAQNDIQANGAHLIQYILSAFGSSVP